MSKLDVFRDLNGSFDVRFWKIKPSTAVDSRSPWIEPLGETHNSVVHRIECLLKDHALDDLAAKFFKADCQIDIKGLLALDHANIVSFKGIFWNRKMHYKHRVFDGQVDRVLVMELCEMDLKRYIEDLNEHDLRIDQKLFVQFSHQVASGLHYLHQRGVIHGDLKTQNVFLTSQNVAKIADFEDHFISNAQGSKTTGGTSGWNAPERVANQTPTRACDYYSFGLVVYSMLIQADPVQVAVDAEYSISYLTEEEVFPELEEWTQTCLVPLLNVDPDAREAPFLNFLQDSACLDNFKNMVAAIWRVDGGRLCLQSK